MCGGLYLPPGTWTLLSYPPRLPLPPTRCHYGNVHLTAMANAVCTFPVEVVILLRVGATVFAPSPKAIRIGNDRLAFNLKSTNEYPRPTSLPLRTSSDENLRRGGAGRGRGRLGFYAVARG